MIAYWTDRINIKTILYSSLRYLSVDGYRPERTHWLLLYSEVTRDTPCVSIKLKLVTGTYILQTKSCFQPESDWPCVFVWRHVRSQRWWPLPVGLYCPGKNDNLLGVACCMQLMILLTQYHIQHKSLSSSYWILVWPLISPNIKIFSKEVGNLRNYPNASFTRHILSVTNNWI